MATIRRVLVRHRAVVRGAVELDGEHLFRTEEIEHVRPIAVLAAELAAGELAPLQGEPEPRFGGSE